MAEIKHSIKKFDCHTTVGYNVDVLSHSHNFREGIFVVRSPTGMSGGDYGFRLLLFLF